MKIDAVEFFGVFQKIDAIFLKNGKVKGRMISSLGVLIWFLIPRKRWGGRGETINNSQGINRLIKKIQIKWKDTVWHLEYTTGF